MLALRRRWPAGLAVWAYYGIVLGPVSGIVHAGIQLAHDRYSYLSCLGWALLVGAAMGHAGRSAVTGALRPGIQRRGRCRGGALGSSPSGRSPWYQLQIWRDTETLWRYAVEADPPLRRSVRTMSVPRCTARDSLYSAKERYELALALRPDLLRMHSGLGMVCHRLGDV